MIPTNMIRRNELFQYDSYQVSNTTLDAISREPFDCPTVERQDRRESEMVAR